LKIRPALHNALLAGAVALSVIPVARATSLIGTGYSAVGSEPVSVTAPSASTNAGSFVGTWNGLPITFWCFELTEFFYFNVEYTDYVELPLVGYGDVARLFQEVGGTAGATSTLVKSAAFQLAIWEIRYESLKLPNSQPIYNLTPGTLTSGNFYATSADSAAVAQANTWLQHLPATSTYSVSLLHSGPPGNEQDFIYERPPLRQNLPEPSPLPLLGLGVAAMMFSIRRRA
jgi:acyl-coenzyme A thioesterase PaaI-like protein